jgi:hypothetical protein
LNRAERSAIVAIVRTLTCVQLASGLIAGMPESKTGPSGELIGVGMARAALQHRLQEAEELVQRVEENIAFQRKMIATPDRGGHDVKAARTF